MFFSWVFFYRVFLRSYVFYFAFWFVILRMAGNYFVPFIFFGRCININGLAFYFRIMRWATGSFPLGKLYHFIFDAGHKPGQQTNVIQQTNYRNKIRNKIYWSEEIKQYR